MINQVLTFLAIAACAAGSLVPTGVTLRLDDVHYFASPFPQGKAYGSPLDIKKPRQFGFIPVTVVADCRENSLYNLFTNWTTKDDVWQPGFLETILLADFSHTSTVRNASYFPNMQSSILPLLEKSDIPSGPYFLNTYTGEVHQAFRLYEDFAGAFSQSLLQRPDGRFETLSAQVPSSASLTIGVPSRLYFKQTKEKPLAGVRIGVKDIFSLAGVKKSCGNRAWYGLYAPANVTGTAMQNLINAGAIIVGHQKPSQFANGETPTADWVDYHAPFNPRGDGYQDPASSSSGAGASVASYNWLDLAVGSDTGGSIRGPAGNQGLFGNRPSHGLVSLDNVMPLSPVMDTVGLLARDPYIWNAASAALYKDNYTSFGDEHSKYPESLYLLDFPSTETAQSKILGKFAAELAAFLNTTARPLDLEKEWEASRPAPAKGQTISQLLNLTYTALITKDQTKLLRDPFYSDYAAVHDGRRPFVDPVSLARWAWGDLQPEAIRTDAITNKTLFMDWFNDKIIPRAPDSSTCSSAILLHTDSTGYFSSRNSYLDPPKLPFGFSNGEISIFTETPDSVFPLGQFPALSSITNHTEFLPVTVDVIVAKGCDGLIGRLAEDLVAAGILTIPKVGSGLDGGEILLRRHFS